MLKRGPAAAAPGTTESPESQAAPAPAPVAHAGTPQACAGAQGAATGGTYTSTQLSSLFGLDQLFAQGRTGIGQSIAIVEFEQYAASDFAAFEACYGLSNSIRNVQVDGGAGGPGQGGGEAALDTELAAFNAPSASLVVYEAPNGDDAQALDVFNRIAGDDSAQVVTTSWGVCEASMPAADRQTENGIFQRMALQGQTVVAASGDAGSEDCLPTNGSDQLAVDDPGSQPDVVSAGGTALTNGAVSAQSVWNDCEGSVTLCSGNTTLGAAGGGYSLVWPANPGQPAASGPKTTPCELATCRAVPDFSYPSDPSAGGVAAYWDGHWTGFGGTSVAAPTNAGLFVDTNQGCFSALGRRRPCALPGASGRQRHLHRRHPGQQRLHGHQRRPLRRHERLRPGQRAGHTRRPEPGACAARRGRLPVGGRRQPRHGAGQRQRRHHDRRRRVRQRHLGDIRVGGRRSHSVADGHLHHRRPAQCAGRPVRGRHRRELAGRFRPIHRRPLRLRRQPQLRRGLPLRRLRRRSLRLRGRRLLGQRGEHPTQRAGGGHGRHAEQPRLLASGVRRRHLHLRRRPLPGLNGRATPQPAGGGHGRHARRRRLLAGGLRRRHLRLRQRAVLRLDRRHAPEQADRGHGRRARRRRLLAGGRRRRHLRLRGRGSSTDRRGPCG